MGKNTGKTCYICNELINILQDDYIKEIKYSHTACFKKHLMTRKRLPLSETGADEKIKIIKDKMEYIQNEKEKKELEKDKIKNQNIKNGITDTSNRDKFIKYVQSEYDIALLDKLFYIKLSQINNGTYKGLSEAISYEDLLYMFKQKKEYLNKIANLKEKNGNGFKNNKLRLNYDLAVIVNKYDSYKEWKEQQKIIESNNSKNQENNVIMDYSNIINNKNKKEKSIDINDILDDI